MKYTIYKITNLIDGKIYIGCHKTNNLDDGYMGSGVYLKRAHEKHGIENFIKEILEIYDNPEDMFESESLLVNEEFVSRDDTYNLKQGGEGGFDYLNSINFDNITHSTKHGRMMYDVGYEKRTSGLKKFFENPELVKQRSFKTTLTCQERTNFEGSFFGKNHSKETKQKIGEKNSIHQKGEGNSMYGSMWIYNLELKESKRITKTEEIPEGWLKGRKMKY